MAQRPKAQSRAQSRPGQRHRTGASTTRPPAGPRQPAGPPTAVILARREALDVARGIAIVAMVIYHFCFDLSFNGWLVADFGEDWRWRGFRTVILGSFLFIAGVSLGLATARGQSGNRFWRRIAIVAVAALLVSAGSYLMFPDSFIWFGVLHAIALMSVLARALLPLGGWLVALGIAIIVAGVTLTSPVFDHRLLQWIGMMTFKPRTEDYVPLFPWFRRAADRRRRRQLAASPGSLQSRDRVVDDSRVRCAGSRGWAGTACRST
jgi:uncharacterized membrane protein